MDLDKRYINQIEVLTTVFTIDKSTLKVYLVRRTEEPFKGYWMIPSNLLMTSETIEECANATAEEFIGINDISFRQCNVFSKVDRLPNDRIVGNSLIGLIDEESLLMHKKATPYEGVWFEVDAIPKMVFDHGMILEDAIKYFNEIKEYLGKFDSPKRVKRQSMIIDKTNKEQIKNKILENINKSPKSPKIPRIIKSPKIPDRKSVV